MLYSLIFREKRARFPKGKKVKQADQVPVVQKPDEEEDVQPETEAQIAARERALRRKMNTPIEEDTDMLHDISVAEVRYKVCSSHSICFGSGLVVQNYNKFQCSPYIHVFRSFYYLEHDLTSMFTTLLNLHKKVDSRYNN